MRIGLALYALVNGDRRLFVLSYHIKPFLFHLSEMLLHALHKHYNGT